MVQRAPLSHVPAGVVPCVCARTVASSRLGRGTPRAMFRERFAGDTRSGVAPEERRYLMSVLAREVLCDVARLLSARGIPVMPLKGVLFQQVLYADPAERPLMDVDVLVPERDFERAIQVLLAAGFHPRSVGRSLVECALTSPRGLTVDLHRSLFSRGRYRLSTEAVFRRAARNEALLGVPVFLAHPYDTAAHLIGKFVSDHEAHDPCFRVAELSHWARHCGIDPQRLARHLRGCGMSRAARYALGRGGELSGDPFFGAVLAALPGDGMGRACVGVARATIPLLKGHSLAALPAHLLNDSVLRAGASLTCSALDRLRHSWLMRQQGKAGGFWAPFFRPPRQAASRVKAARGGVPRPTSGADRAGVRP